LKKNRILQANQAEHRHYPTEHFHYTPADVFADSEPPVLSDETAIAAG
jgi:hypothetical protein